MKLLANKVHIQGMEVLLADKVHKQEPQHVGMHFIHATISLHNSKIMWHLPCH